MSLRESINSLKRKYSQSSEPTDSDAAIERTLSEVAKQGCQFLLDEVFLDLEVRRILIISIHDVYIFFPEFSGGYEVMLKREFTSIVN